MEEDQGEIVIPVLAESLHVDTATASTGGVRVIKRIVTDQQMLDHHLRTENVEIKRIPMNKVVDGPQPTIQTDDLIIIPVVQEVLKIERQWVVTEEIHVSKSAKVIHVQEPIGVAHEVVTIERLDAASANPNDKNPESVAHRTEPS